MLSHEINLPALFIVLGIVVGVGALGLWGVHRTSGRPIREMLALLGAAFLIIAFMVPLGLCLDEWSKSPDLAIRELAKLVFALISLLLMWSGDFLTNYPSQNRKQIRTAETAITTNQLRNLDPNGRRTTIYIL